MLWLVIVLGVIVYGDFFIWWLIIELVNCVLVLSGFVEMGLMVVIIVCEVDVVVVVFLMVDYCVVNCVGFEFWIFECLSFGGDLD